MAKPSQQLEDYLEGRNPSPDKAIESWAQYFIYRKALSILKLPKEKRLNVINQAPAYLVEKLKNEITRIWRFKNETNRSH